MASPSIAREPSSFVKHLVVNLTLPREIQRGCKKKKKKKKKQRAGLAGR